MTFNEQEMQVVMGFGTGLSVGIAVFLATESLIAMAGAHFVGVIGYFVVLATLEGDTHE